MHKTLLNLFLITCIGLLIVNCANRGMPEGGPKDISAPVIIKSEPDNYSTNFNGNEIKIYFDEFVKIKDLQKQLVISPPMNTKPEVSPIGGASKSIKIKIYDTLQPNTTYAFNFGNSIVDNNEDNPYPYYRHVISTGNKIDSLKVKGSLLDALNKQTETFVSVGLYEVDSTFNDSIVYKKTPKYITNTLDSISFSIENIKAGKYLLMALKDNNGDNKFQQKSDKIAFHKTHINVPTDSIYTLKLFSEHIDFKAMKPKLLSGEKIAFGYEGNPENMQIELKSEMPKDFEHRITKDQKKDSLYYWYKPRLEVDSLVFKVKKDAFEKEFSVRISQQKRDTLTFSASATSIIEMDAPFKIYSSTPLVGFDDSKITIIDKDSAKVDFTTAFDKLANSYELNFKKTPENSYKINILPNALTDFFEKTNDTLGFALKTKSESEYGYVRFNLNNANFPVIIQLTDDKDEVKYEMYATKAGFVDFFNIIPGKYAVRVIFDSNGNKFYDPGNYLKKIQPERVVHFDMDEDIRPDWGLVQTLNFKE